MAILVDFFAGDPAAIRRSLESGRCPTRLPARQFKGSVSFKFSIMPDDAFDALIRAAAQLTRTEPFSFADCLSGQSADGGESYHGTVNKRFIDLLASCSQAQAVQLADLWTESLRALSENAPVTPQRRRPSWRKRLAAGAQIVLFGAVVYPILGLCYLSPSFRKQRAENQKKAASTKSQAAPSNAEPITTLIQLCGQASQHRQPLTYTWCL